MCLVATKECTAGPGSQDGELCGLWKLSNRAQFGQFWVKKRGLSHVLTVSETQIRNVLHGASIVADSRRLGVSAGMVAFHQLRFDKDWFFTKNDSQRSIFSGTPQPTWTKPTSPTAICAKKICTGLKAQG